MGSTTLKLIKQLLSCIFCMSCPLVAQTQDTPVHITYTDELIKLMTPILEREFDLACTGTGGSMAKHISSISLMFNASRRASISEARALQVKCTERLLHSINANEKLRPFLAEYPFTAERINVSIGFHMGNIHYSDGTVAFVSMGRGQLHYALSDPLTQLLEDLFIEPYSEALQIVQQSQLAHTDLRSHEKKTYENDLDTFLISCAQEIRKKYHMQCQAVGGNLSDGLKEFGFLFTSNKRTTLEEARKLEVGITNTILNKINANEKLRAYLATYPFPVGRTHVRLKFQNSEWGDPLDNSLYSVCQTNDHIQYHYREAIKEDAPTILDAILIKEESYDDALQILGQTHAQK